MFFGCSYEFVKCYVDKKNLDDENDEYNIQTEIIDNQEPKNRCIIFLLIVCGIICQPLYLMIYILYGLMECYRRFNCWFYYIDY